MAARWVGRRDWLSVAFVTVAAAVAATAVVGTPATAPASTGRSGQTPAASIRVTPATGLVDGQTVEVEVTGMTGDITIAQCDPDHVPGNTVHCLTRRVSSEGGAVTVPFTVQQEYDTYYRDEIDHTVCGGVVADCLMVAVGSDLQVAATTPIHFGPPRPDRAVIVTPAAGLRHGDPVQVEVTGLGFVDQLEVLQCEREVAAALPDEPVLTHACRRLGSNDGVPSDRFTVSGTIAEAWVWEGPDGLQGAHCGPEPGGCVIVVYGIADGLVVATPIDVEPRTLAVVPDAQEAGFPVHVFVAGRPSTSVLVAQCATPVRPTARASRCAPAQRLTLDETGDGASSLTVQETITTRHRTFRCAPDNCALALFSSRGAALASAPLVVHPPDAPPEVSVDPSVDLVEGQGVYVTVAGTRNATVTIAQCDASVTAGGRLDEARCQEALTTSVGYSVPELQVPLPVTRVLVTGDGSTVRCGDEPGDCVFAVEVDPGGFASAPISFAPPPVATLTPATGLLEGQPMTFQVTGLQPGVTYEIERCSGRVVDWTACTGGEVPPVVASPEGVITTTVPAHQLLTGASGAPRYCRRQCHVGVQSEPITLTPYAMAEGLLAASPADDLIDGQLVTVTGTELMPSYDGPELQLARVGAWGLVECSRDVIADATLAGAYRHCAVPPGGGVVDVAGSELSADVRVQITFDTLTGQPVDCATGPDACVLALVRVEQDETMSLITTPIRFADLSPEANGRAPLAGLAATEPAGASCCA